jgi:hypothetical protein
MKLEIMKVKDFKLRAESINLGFQIFKNIMPIITKKENKKNINKIITGKWHKK